MKKSLITLFILALLIPSVLAIEVTSKDEFKMGETFSAKFSGNFIDPVLRENVAFYRVSGGKHTLIPADYDIVKIEEEYYLWAVLPEKEDNYTIEIKDVRYKVGTSESTEDIITEFKVTEEKAAIQINPAVAYTYDNFEILVQNMLDKKISVDIETLTVSGDTSSLWFFETASEEGSETVISLKSGESENINFEVNAIDLPSLKDITISSGDTSYTIPVYIFRNVTSNISLPRVPKIEYDFSLVELDFKMATSTNKTKILFLKNNGEDPIENISISFSGILKKYMEISVENISELKEGESRKIELYFNSGNEEKEIEGQLSANVNGGNYEYMPIFFEIIDGYVPAEGVDTNDSEVTYACNKCGSGKICEASVDSNGCCLGLCADKETNGDKEESTTGKIVGWVIIIVIIGFLIWFFKFKYKGTKRKKVDLVKRGRKSR